MVLARVWGAAFLSSGVGQAASGGGGGEDDDLQIGPSVVSLRCPNSGMRIGTPARFKVSPSLLRQSTSRAQAMAVDAYSLSFIVALKDKSRCAICFITSWCCCRSWNRAVHVLPSSPSVLVAWALRSLNIDAPPVRARAV